MRRQTIGWVLERGLTLVACSGAACGQGGRAQGRHGGAGGVPETGTDSCCLIWRPQAAEADVLKDAAAELVGYQNRERTEDVLRIAAFALGVPLERLEGAQLLLARPPRASTCSPRPSAAPARRFCPGC